MTRPAGPRRFCETAGLLLFCLGSSAALGESAPPAGLTDPDDMPVAGWKDGTFYDALNRRVPDEIGPARVKLLDQYLGSLGSGAAPVERFAILGDSKSYGTFISPWFRAIIDALNRARVRTVIHLGDAIPVGGLRDRAQIERKWEQHFDPVVGRFNGRIYQLVGNHDCGTDAGEEPYLKRAGKFFYSFEIGKVHVAVLNNAYDRSMPEKLRDTGLVSDEQVEWLRRDLARARSAGKIRFVAAHNPSWASGRNSARYKNWMEKVHPLIVENRVEACFAGSIHCFAWRAIDGVDYFISGGAGARFSQRSWAYAFHHFVVVDVSEKKTAYTVINLHGPAE